MRNLTDKFYSFQGWSYNQSVSAQMPEHETLKALYSLKVPTDSSWVINPKRNLIIDIAKPDFGSVGSFGEEIIKVLDFMRNDFKIRSLYLTKLRARKSLTGFMIVGIEDSMPHLDDIELIERLSEPIGIAFYNRLLLEENSNYVEQLKESNEKLKTIDESKDEFISMASHQLRTPLTSMKGCVSMVLEGDTGPITDLQRSLLEQAFDSSQRMVYLISDLLNVSRLHTGKFVINNSVTDLTQLVESELKQLNKTAESRKIVIIYQSPQGFPLVNLDETKIRQVIMNFLDNALYYTPAGGKIEVSLMANEKNIEYTVTDTGLGVPKNERHLLFTKFYRAENARKMRPDGTGLGLYMAQKVVVAQGGSIIFKSDEGKGSTFGFSFPRDKIEAKHGEGITVDLRD